MQISNDEYQQYQPLLFSLGYRLLGSITDAEDIVQETFLRAHQIEEKKLDNKKAYLCKMMTNRCLDLLKSARYNREHYIGPWNPEPLLISQFQDSEPSRAVLEKEGLSIAYLRMMEHLTPHERVVLLLKEGFDFSYSEIVNIIDKKEENCRKLFSRAKQKLSSVVGESLNYQENKSIVDSFIQAFQKQNTDELLELVSEKVTLFSDGGGKVNAALRPIQSNSNVLAFLFGVASKLPSNVYFNIENVNGQPGIVSYSDEKIHSVISFYIFNNKFKEIYITMNPDKLPSII
ncbi:RNA polymerase sigma-70 factor [Aquibacillus halophilus]|uniref:RNA polymerase sigma-70 factor n=1 Tax=Aquibacillus halophilus TaxID=930132 RepID=A0A6A8D649_9BACI|nr:RNA polymerase sigma-70 factor [Aquibacillus halophilus]